MEISQIMELIPQDFYIVAVTLYVLGMVLKRVNFIKDELIIFILLILSILFTVWKGGFGADTVMYGVILTGVPVFVNNIFMVNVFISVAAETAVFAS